MIYAQSIPDFKKNKTQTLAEKLTEQYKDTLDLIIHHEWMIDLINSKLSLEQFETLITQEAYLYNQLAKHLLRLEINHSKEEQETLTKVGVFLYSEASENLNLLDKNYPLSCSTRTYSGKLENIWKGKFYPHKILSLLVRLWIREGIFQILSNEKFYVHNYKEWPERVTNNSPHDLIHFLSRILNQYFLNYYGQNEESLHYQEGFRELEHLVSRLLQFELAIRNHAYHINFYQFQPSKKGV